MDRWLETGRNNCPACRTQVRFFLTRVRAFTHRFVIRAYLPRGRSPFQPLRRQLTNTRTPLPPYFGPSRGAGHPRERIFGPLVVGFFFSERSGLCLGCLCAIVSLDLFYSVLLCLGKKTSDALTLVPFDKSFHARHSSIRTRSLFALVPFSPVLFTR